MEIQIRKTEKEHKKKKFEVKLLCTYWLSRVKGVSGLRCVLGCSDPSLNSSSVGPTGASLISIVKLGR